jgi:excinuclease UvrABC nuclease subunit
MLEAARSVEWIVVDTEVEALHLEYTLIQRTGPATTSATATTSPTRTWC